LFSNASIFEVESRRVIYGREIHMARLRPATTRITPKADIETLRAFLQGLAGGFPFEDAVLLSALLQIESSGNLLLREYAMEATRIAATIHRVVAPIHITVGITEIVLKAIAMPAL
jgi:hypothetical protein